MMLVYFNKKKTNFKQNIDDKYHQTTAIFLKKQMPYLCILIDKRLFSL